MSRFSTRSVYREFADAKQIVLDVRARDSVGRQLNIEMQVSVLSWLLQRVVYYACSMFVEQLSEGDGYHKLNAAVSICLLPNALFKEESARNVPHHRFRLVDPEQKRELPDMIEVHTVELSKFDLDEDTISTASDIEQWAFFFLYADQYDSERLRELLPGVEFQQAISVIETIAAKTEDRKMYDQRQKALRDHQWGLNTAREEGREEGARIGQIQLLESLLGQAPSAADCLLKCSRDELDSRIEELQTELRSRGSNS
ncbi:MAG: Rpn family recombination-promoting nuclease/putative transposase [Planctomycetota bacterium]|nr:Rpn family recombination-promoting nuclease/putative transposase [Planctomycetota bacterium]